MYRQMYHTWILWVMKQTRSGCWLAGRWAPQNKNVLLPHQGCTVKSEKINHFNQEQKIIMILQSKKTPTRLRSTKASFVFEGVTHFRGSFWLFETSCPMIVVRGTLSQPCGSSFTRGGLSIPYLGLGPKGRMICWKGSMAIATPTRFVIRHYAPPTF